MFALMYRHRGRGLAAPQVGLPWRLFIINPTGDPNQPALERVFINPQVVSAKLRRHQDEEGCLSLPGLYAPVERPRTIKVRFEDLDGRVVGATYDGPYSRIFQHELDHLDGVLLIDRLEPEELAKLRPQLEAWERQALAAGGPL
jgi:peptide deformylase